MPLKKIPDSRLIALFGQGAEMRVKFKDVFDLKEFYKALRQWLLEHHWGATFSGDYWETYYGERIAMGGVKEIWARWRLKKAAWGTKLTYYLDFDWHGVGLTTTEVVKEGQKLKLDKGEIEIKIKAFIEKTYEEEFDKSSLLKPFKEIFSKRVYLDELKMREKELYHEVYELQNFMKQWFKMKRYLPYEETPLFFKSRAYPSHLQGS